MSSNTSSNSSIYDVFKVRHILRWKVTKDGLPLEIVDLIIDAAEYWPWTETNMEEKTVIQQDLDQELLRSLPLCFDKKSLKSTPPKPLPHRTAHPCRKIIFSITSKDQDSGHSVPAHQKYEASWTWFDTKVTHRNHEAGVNATQTEPAPSRQNRRHFKPGDPDLLPGVHKLQTNRKRESEMQHYTVVWHHLDNISADSAEAEEIELSEGRGRATLDGSTVRQLEVGDSISVWGKARFPEWSNHVERVSVKIYWAV